jgi:hypothetical protein
MDLNGLERFAAEARKALMRAVEGRLELTLAPDSVESLTRPEAVAELKKALSAKGQGEKGKKAFTEEVAYTWFNRFCALRFMDARNYTGVRVVSPGPGGTRPEVLAEALAGNYGPEIGAEARERVAGLLSGAVPSADAHNEAYRILFLAACNAWSEAMPYLFEKLGDWTELLLPVDLLSAHSVLSAVREAIREEDCANVELVGWLYQFYVSERKAEVYEGFKRGKKAEAADIPAATELFTPKWVVKFLAENSLGRLGAGGGEGRGLEYWVPDGEGNAETVRRMRPEDIRVCDPCCGSGHMLVQAFDLLAGMYLAEGYAAGEIPALILEKNLTGLDIDPRAAALAGFALAMKARERDRRFFERGRTRMPRVLALRPVAFEEGELAALKQAVGLERLPLEAWRGLDLFAEADNFGALVSPEACDWSAVRKTLKGLRTDSVLLQGVRGKALKAAEMAEALAPDHYDAVITNPPYMGGKNMNARLKVLAEDHYPDSKGDLFAMFIERCHQLAKPDGFVAMVTMQSWMFLSSFEGLRKKLLQDATMICMAHMGNMVMRIAFGTSATVWQKRLLAGYEAGFCYVEDRDLDECEQPRTFPPDNGRNQQIPGWQAKPLQMMGRQPSNHVFFRSNSDDFDKIPGSPIAYWLSEKQLRAFLSPKLEERADPRTGFTTGDNDAFLRYWWEVDSLAIGKKWFYLNKGGEFHKWFGNNEFVVDWENSGERIKAAPGSTIRNSDYYFREGVTWSKISSRQISGRYSPSTNLFDAVGLECFAKGIGFPDIWQILAVFNAKTTTLFLSVINPTMSFSTGPVGNLPVPNHFPDACGLLAKRCFAIASFDWNAYETSWDFRDNPLVATFREHPGEGLEVLYTRVRAGWRSSAEELKRLEEENNRQFIEAYGLEGEVGAEVEWEEVSLTCNPWYRYKKAGGTGAVQPEDAELEKRLREDTAKELVSYAVGCMMGRYSLEKPGLVMAGGETNEERVDGQGRFAVDADGIVPVLEANWFEDDAGERFTEFLKAAFGEERVRENLAWVEESLGKGVREYFSKDFWKDHAQRYRKRPIYWLFASPRGAFQALVYAHRYGPDTTGRVLGYLRSHILKTQARREELDRRAADESLGRGARTAAVREKTKLDRALLEMERYEREVLHPLATRRLALDLDDGVAANLEKLGAAVKQP